MKKAKLIVRMLLGLMVLIFGLNKFLQFIPMPSLPEAAGEFMGALVKSGYLMHPRKPSILPVPSLILVYLNV